MELLAIVGPTASGKTVLSLRMAREQNGEIISVDSRQIYRHLSVGTAKPAGAWTPEGYEVEGIRHHLVDICEPTETFSAADFIRRAEPTIAQIQARGHKPILVGGTGLYFKALSQGLAPLPKGDESVRADLRRILHEQGSSGLHDELKRVDPDAAAVMSPAHTTRLMRAIEVFRLTNKPISQWHREHQEERASRGDKNIRFKAIGIAVDKAVLHKRIQERCQRMLEEGMIEETDALLKQGLAADCPAFSGVGYPRVIAYLQGRTKKENILAALIQDTRQYAKRQMTWFRNQMDISWKK
jgi:tRNA dimethylallyltransferase